MQVDKFMDVDQMDQENMLTSDVITKYKTAADIANEVMKQVINSCIPGKQIIEICSLGDSLILELSSKVFKKSGFEKGIAFPTCISLNSVIQNFTPKTIDDSFALSPFDLCKIELSVHIDGYIATTAHTVIVPSPNPQTAPYTGKIADVICATHFASEVAVRLLKPGNKASQVNSAINSIASHFNCSAVMETGSFIMKRYIIEGDEYIPNSPSFEEEEEDFEFEENQVYALNIIMATGNTGESVKDSTVHETCIAQRDVNKTYQLKLKASRTALSHITKNYSVFPFSLRSLIGLDRANILGLNECVNHGMVVQLPVKEVKQKWDADGEKVVVSQFKSSILIMPSGKTDRITLGGQAFGLPFVHSEYDFDTCQWAKVLKEGGVKNAKGDGLKMIPRDMEMDMS